MNNVYEKLADALDTLPNGFPRTESGSDIKLLKYMYTEQEAELACQLTKEAESVKEIAERLNKLPKEVQAGLLHLAKGGKAWMDMSSGRQKFRLAAFIVGSYEAHVEHMNEEMAELFETYLNDGGVKSIMKWQPSVHRVIPTADHAELEWILPYDNVIKILDEAKSVLKGKVKELIDISFEHEEFSYTSLIYEFKVDLNKYLSTVRDFTNIHTLKDLIEFNKQDSEKRLKYGQSIFEASEKTSGALKEPEYIDARKDVLNKAMKFNEVMLENDLDVIIMTRRTSHAPIAGNPCVCVPAKALTDDIPRSLFFVSKNFDDSLCLQIAYQYEKSTNKRIAPKL